ncbi:MAG TPA: nuclear transport factor 2 family protein [Pyrinomonadaceae bacterium]|nr:nuclear transport factor 2 family protein [Pyrinomonadaceae bacterium]
MPDAPRESFSKVEAEQTLRELNEDWVKALVRKDGETLNSIMADDFFFAYPMEGDDKDQFIGDVVSGDVSVTFLKRENVGVRIWGSTAVITAKDSATWFYKGHDYSGVYKIINVYCHLDGRWQLCSIQSCPIT